MKFTKIHFLIFFVLVLNTIYCSPTSDSIQKNIDPEVSDLVMLSPEKGAHNVPINSALIWEKIDGSSRYEVQLSNQHNFSDLIVNLVVDSSRIELNGLPFNKKIYWRVRTIMNDKPGLWSQIFDFTTEIKSESSRPIATTLKSPPNHSVNQPLVINLGWTFVVSAANYQLQVATDAAFENLFLAEYTEETELSVSNLELGRTYYWRVLANVEGVETSWSETWVYSTETALSSTIKLVDPKNGSADQPIAITLIWEGLFGVLDYNIQVAADNSFQNAIINDVIADTLFHATNLDYKTSYYWRVCVNGGSSWSEVWSFSTEEEPIPPVTLIAPSNNSTDQPTNLTLKWEEIEGVTSYRIQLAKTNTFSNTVLDELVNQANFEITGLNEDQRYFWRVRADGSEAWANTWNFTTKKSSPPPSSDDFVDVSNSNFVIDGRIFRFAGTNAYYLPNYEKLDSKFVDSTLDTFEDTGITVVRMWAFYDGYDCGYSQQNPDENVIQTDPGEYSESALRDLDKVIAKGKDRGIRFLLPFVNYWDELGGICQYNTWDGASNPSTNMSHFINSDNTQKWFKKYIKMLLNRVNTVTGVPYKKEPAIFGWEIMNEGRYSGQDPDMLRNWYREIALYIKSIDSNHLLTTGEEGFDEGTPSQYSVDQYSNTYVLRAGEGTSYIMNTAIPEIDFGSAHWYPSDWGFGYSFNQDLTNAQHAWLNDHQKIAESLGKPFVLGEYGYDGWGNQEVLNIYTDQWSLSEDIKLDGSALWQFTTNYVKCYEFGGNICWPEGRQDTNLYNSFRHHINYMNNRN